MAGQGDRGPLAAQWCISLSPPSLASLPCQRMGHRHELWGDRWEISNTYRCMGTYSLHRNTGQIPSPHKSYSRAA
jgi:hypothetical protein